MAEDSVLETISRFRIALEARGVRVQKMVLFGSCATGAQDSDSDIDLAVVSRDFEGKGFWERVEIISGAVYDVFAPIEATTFTPDEWERGDSLIAQFAREGRVVFAA
jgi:uncharacterized protein